MIKQHLRAVLLILCCAAAGFSQITLNTSPSREVGQPKPNTQGLLPETANPNLVEGRELFAPLGVALDTSVSPPIIYVADTGNNRVMAWKNAAAFKNGAPADLIIGQTDNLCTQPEGPGLSTTCPGSNLSTGLNAPVGLAVDSSGNMYVADTGNNRILRFPKPFAQPPGTFPVPDEVIGQPNFSSNRANFGGQNGGPSPQGVALSGFESYLAFDSSGNLWVTDAGNRRVLRYPANNITGGGASAAADMEVGQPTLTSSYPRNLDPSSITDLRITNQFGIPAGLAFDSKGRLYVADSLNRVLVFSPPFSPSTLASAGRIMGVIIPGTTPPPQAQIDQTIMNSPTSIFLLLDDSVGVADSGYNRILVFPPFAQWPDPSTTYSPQATGVVGQSGSFHNTGANGTTSLTIATPAAGANSLWNPSATAFFKNEVYVADTSNNRVIVLPQLSSSSQVPLGPANRVLGQDAFNTNAINLIEGREFDFLLPNIAADGGIAIDNSSGTPHLYVADTYNNRILGFKDLRNLQPGAHADLVIGQGGNFNTNLVNYPTGDANTLSAAGLFWPTGLLVDSQGNLYVADRGNGRVLRFPSPFANIANEQADLVLGQSSFTGPPIKDASNSHMSAPYGLAFTGTNGLLVSDQVHNRVLFFRFSANGTFSTSDSGKAAEVVYGQPDFVTTTPGSGTGNLSSPHHLAADSSGRPYVADSGNNRVMIFADPGTASTPRTGSRALFILPNLNQPRGVYVNPVTSEIWVTSGGQSIRYPDYDSLPINQAQTANISNASTVLALAQDSLGDLVVADATSRIAIYYQGLAVLNGATFYTDQLLAPGMVASIFGINLNQFGSASDGIAATLPLPLTLAGVQVLFNGTPAPLYYAGPSANQINFFVPNGAPSTGNADLVVQQVATGQIFGATTIPMNNVSPGIFALNCGAGLKTCYAAVINTADGTCQPAPGCFINGPSHAAARGSIISIYATGEGNLPNAPPDGSPAPGTNPGDTLVTTTGHLRVVIGSCIVGNAPNEDLGPGCTRQPGDPPAGQWVPYSGLAPGLVGVWQINVQIPMAVPPGLQQPLAIVYDDVNGTSPSEPYKTVINVK